MDYLVGVRKSPRLRVAVGNVLRELRLQKGFSQERLAELASLHRTYVGGVERGERNPSIESIERVLNALGSSWSSFGRELNRKRRD
jgi:transcriptional regulator with XRE-family HTH domain